MLRFLAAGAFIALVAAGGTAGAQVSSEYARLVDEAMREGGAGHWDEARALFRAAHALDPNARTLRGIGMVSFELRDYPEAYRSLRASLAEPRRALDERQRRDVTALLERVRARIAVLDVAPTADEIAIVVDGSPTALESDRTLVLGLGRHVIELTSRGTTTTREIEVHGGESGTLASDAPMVVSSASDPSAPASRDDGIAGEASGADPGSPIRAAGPTARHLRSRRAELTKRAFLVSGGAAIAMSTFALGFGLRDRARVLDASSGTEWSVLANSNRRAPRLVASGIGIAATGVALAAVGVAFAIRSRHDDHENVIVSIAPTSASMEVSF